MGNYVSCTLSGPAAKCATVIFPGGDVRAVSSPTKAAELMLETPNFFLVNSRSLQIGRRFRPLGADDDIESGNVYVMFPMGRLATAVAATDMAAMFFAAKRVSGGGGGGMRRILPEMECGDSNGGGVNVIRACGGGDKLKLDEIEGYSTAEIKQRLSMTRSRKPLLETIAEEPGRGRRLGRRMSLKLIN